MTQLEGEGSDFIDVSPDFFDFMDVSHVVARNAQAGARSCSGGFDGSIDDVGACTQEWRVVPVVLGSVHINFLFD